MLSVLVYRNFGWRILQRMNVDFRLRGAALYRTLALSQNLFSAALKLDFLFEVQSCYMWFGPCIAFTA